VKKGGFGRPFSMYPMGGLTQGHDVPTDYPVAPRLKLDSWPVSC